LGFAGPVSQEFMETNRYNPVGSDKERKQRRDALEQSILGGARMRYREYHDRIVVPGFISSSPIAEIATLVGPVGLTASYRMGDTLYFRWQASSQPSVGERYAVYTPAWVLQNLDDPTDFVVRIPPGPGQKLPPHHRLAGYFYEKNGVVRIVKVNQGLVQAILEAMNGQVSINDQLMPMLPVHKKINPIRDGVDLAAAVVSGSPPVRMSTSAGTFIYINRGSRDGIRVGRVFQAVETIPLNSSVPIVAPEQSAGEAMVVHVSDSFSTAVITKQFDLIRVGALLKTQRADDNLPRAHPFEGFAKQSGGEAPTSVPPATEIPNLNEGSMELDPTLPDPNRPAAPPVPSLSDLDQLEKSMNLRALTPEERAKLGKLSRQENLDGGSKESSAEDAPEISAPENSFKDTKKPVKKKTPKRMQSNDEEELNLLIMEN
jgi:hypothetical protein